MANIIAGDRYKTPFAGEDGNVSSWSGYYKHPAAGTVGDTIELCEVPAGAKIDEIDLIWAGLTNTTATIAIGWKYKDGNAGGAANGRTGTPSATAFRAATAVGAAAGNVQLATLPHGQFPVSTDANIAKATTPGVVDSPIILYITNGVAVFPANGEVYVKAQGEFVGTK